MLDSLNLKDVDAIELKDVINAIYEELASRKEVDKLENSESAELRKVYDDALRSETCNVTIQKTIDINILWSPDDDIHYKTQEDLELTMYEGDNFMLDDFSDWLSEEDKTKLDEAKQKIDDRLEAFESNSKVLCDKYGFEDWEVLDICEENKW